MAKRTDPVVLAKRALADVLTRAIGSKDDDRILASAKQVLSMLDKPAATGDVTHREPRLDVSKITDEEFRILGDLLRQMYLLKKRVALRLGDEFEIDRTFEPEAFVVELSNGNEIVSGHALTNDQRAALTAQGEANLGQAKVRGAGIAPPPSDDDPLGPDEMLLDDGEE